MTNKEGPQPPQDNKEGTEGLTRVVKKAVGEVKEYWKPTPEGRVAGAKDGQNKEGTEGLTRVVKKAVGEVKEYWKPTPEGQVAGGQEDQRKGSSKNPEEEKELADLKAELELEAQEIYIRRIAQEQQDSKFGEEERDRLRDISL
jgi:hypothetical protein